LFFFSVGKVARASS